MYESKIRESEVPHEFICPITGEIMKNPVVIASGRSYEKQSILEWFSRGRIRDPMTGEELGSAIALPNLNLKILIDELPERLRAQKKKSLETAIK